MARATEHGLHFSAACSQARTWSENEDIQHFTWKTGSRETSPHTTDELDIESAIVAHPRRVCQGAAGMDERFREGRSCQGSLLTAVIGTAAGFIAM